MRGENDIFKIRQNGYFVLYWVALDQIFEAETQRKIDCRMLQVMRSINVDQHGASGLGCRGMHCHLIVIDQQRSLIFGSAS